MIHLNYLLQLYPIWNWKGAFYPDLVGLFSILSMVKVGEFGVGKTNTVFAKFVFSVSSLEFGRLKLGKTSPMLSTGVSIDI